MSTQPVDQHARIDDDRGASVVIPAIELRGSLRDRLQTLDSAIARLYSMRGALAGEPVPGAPPNEVYGRYVNAPVWPWFTAGCVIGALFVLVFVIAWSYS
jgi:hypothetical protein